MEHARTRILGTLAAVLLAVGMACAAVFAQPAQAHAESAPTADLPLTVKADAADASIQGIWVVPEIISGSRQPASGGMFAWVAFDYSYEGASLHKALNPADFMLQMKTQGGEWTDVPGNNIVVLGGSEYYIASIEAIVAARVPDNTDPFVKKWRVVYKPTGMEGEVIVQAANLPTTDDITVYDYYTCTHYKVEQVPWSFSEYEQDHVLPIYITHVQPYALAHIEDGGFTVQGDHKVIQPWTLSVMPFSDDGIGYGADDFSHMDTKLYLGVAEDESGTGKDDGIAALVQYWNDLGDYGMTPSSTPIPNAEALYNKIASAAYVPDESADEWLMADMEGAAVLWVTGAGTQERVGKGVTGYILVVVRDWAATGVVQHHWGEPTWEWTGSSDEGYTAAKATFKCKDEGRADHVETPPVTLTSEVQGGERIYTATVTLDGKEYTDTQKVANTSKMDAQDALKKAIDAAQADLDATMASADGKDVPDGAAYVSSDAHDQFTQALNAAKLAYAPETAEDALLAAAQDLAAAQKAFDDAKQTAKVDKTTLANVVKAARDAQKGVKVSEDGKDVSTNDVYTSAETKRAFDELLAVAEEILASPDSSQLLVDSAVWSVIVAHNSYEAAKKPGTKQAAVNPEPDPKPTVDPKPTPDPDPTVKPARNVGRGADAAAAEAAIAASASEEGPAGTAFAALQLRSPKQAAGSITLKWAKAKGAARYVVYGAPCGKGGKMKKVATLGANKAGLTVKKVAGKKLAKGKYYRFIVLAVGKNGKVVSTSKAVHAATKGGKAANPTGVTTKAKKGKVALAKGKTFKLAAKAAGLKGKAHRAVKYETSNKKIASVSAKGVVKARGKGSCYVYAYAQNGVFAKVKVTVK